MDKSFRDELFKCQSNFLNITLDFSKEESDTIVDNNSESNQKNQEANDKQSITGNSKLIILGLGILLLFLIGVVLCKFCRKNEQPQGRWNLMARNLSMHIPWIGQRDYDLE